MRVRFFTLCVLVIAACRSERTAYERIAKEINPSLIALKPMAAIVLSINREDLDTAARAAGSALDAALKAAGGSIKRDRLRIQLDATLPPFVKATTITVMKINEACKSADDILVRLDGISLAGIDPPSTTSITSLPRYARELIYDRVIGCPADDEDGDPLPFIRCSRFCYDQVHLLATAVEELRKEAAKDGVDIVSLEQ